jgi:hypothetical protein
MDKRITPSTASSSRQSGESRRARRRNTSVNSPEFLHGKMRRLQTETASDIRLQTMARIGELYLDQSSSSSIDERKDEICEVDGGVDTSDREEESNRRVPYYHGFNHPVTNSSPRRYDTPPDRRENDNEVEMFGARSGA